MKASDVLNKLVSTALRLGAGDAALIPASRIVVKEALAGLCAGDTRCEQYGLAAGCPPHVEGPSGFRTWLAKCDNALVVRIDVPVATMFCEKRLAVMKRLHEIVAGVEHEARAMGYPQAKAFAGGSCKQLFCREQAACQVVAGGKPCLHAARARPSMSGFGVDVAALMNACGWPAPMARREQAADPGAMTWICGLILIS